MKKADASLARFAVLIGEDEVAANQVTVKSLRGEFGQQPEQQRLSLADAIELLKAGL
jgi:histidyl-tRNA synthetase